MDIPPNAVEVTNSKLSQQRARIKKAKDWLYAIPIQNAPMMLDMMNHIADEKNLNTHGKRIRNLQTYAKAVFFLQSSGIRDIEQLADKIEQMSRWHYEVANAIKEKTRRIGTLTKHLEQYEIQKQNKAVYQKYQQLDPKKRGAYTEKHAEEIRLYKEAPDCFKAVMNGRTELPLKKWKKEFIDITKGRLAACP